MSDTYRTAQVLFDADYSGDGAERLVAALEMVKGVSRVLLGEPLDCDDYFKREAGQRELSEIIWRVLGVAHRLGGEDAEKYKRLKELLGVKESR